MKSIQFIQYFNDFIFRVAISSVQGASWRGMCQITEPSSLKKYKKQ